MQQELKSLMLQDGYSSLEIENFSKLYENYKNSSKNADNLKDKFYPLEKENFISIEKSEQLTATRKQELLKQLVVCRFNGGLGTSMYCNLPKALIPIKDNKHFLDFTVIQIQKLQAEHKITCPLLLMNSFYTDKIIQQEIKNYSNLTIYSFNQNCFPRLLESKNNLNLPLLKKEHGLQACYPPGHGDFFANFIQSGLLKQFLEQGKRYIFLANIDNLGATIDFSILNYLASSNCHFIMEVTKKLKTDLKGGSLLRNKTDNKIKLLESAELSQYSEQQLSDFKKNFSTFNTNNIWIDLVDLQKKLEQADWSLDLIKNKKEVAKKNVFQLEIIAGSAISNFPTAKLIKVSRSRFIPIKKLEDLLYIRSNLFSLKNGFKFKNLKKFNDFPKLNLQSINSIILFEKIFKKIPDLLNLKELTIDGEKYLEKK